jgi:hypothetical protein
MSLIRDKFKIRIFVLIFVIVYLVFLHLFYGENNKLF